MSLSSSRKNLSLNGRKSKRLADKFFSSSDSGSGDEEQNVTRVTRSSGKKQKASTKKSGVKSAREESPERSCEIEPKTPRSSSRLKAKANRSFTLPSRESVLDDLSPPLHGSARKAKVLKPRKLVNNFVRE